MHGRCGDADAETADGNWKMGVAWKCFDMHSRLSDWLGRKGGGSSPRGWTATGPTMVAASFWTGLSCFPRALPLAKYFGAAMPIHAKSSCVEMIECLLVLSPRMSGRVCNHRDEEVAAFN